MELDRNQREAAAALFTLALHETQVRREKHLVPDWKRSRCEFLVRSFPFAPVLCLLSQVEAGAAGLAQFDSPWG